MAHNPYEDLSAYELAHLISHLLDCDLTQDIHDILGSNENNYWFEQKASNNLFESYIQDVKLAIHSVFAEFDRELVNDNKYQIGIGLIFKYGLILSSTTSSMQRLASPEYAALLVKKNIWSIARAYTLISDQGEFVYFLEELFKDHEYVTPEDTLDEIIGYISKLENPAHKISLISNISLARQKIHAEEIKKQAVDQLIAMSTSESVLELLSTSEVARLSTAIDSLKPSLKKSVLQNMSANLVEHNSVEQEEALLNLTFLAQNEVDLFLPLLDSYLGIVKKEESPSRRINGYARILPALKNNSDISQVYTNILKELDKAEKEGSKIQVNISDVCPFISTKDLLDFAYFAINKKKFHNQKAEALSFIASRASQIGSKKDIVELTKIIENNFNDACCRTIALSGFGSHLSNRQIQTMIDDVLQYPILNNLHGDRDKLANFDGGIRSILPFIGEDTFKSLLDLIESQNINVVWWGVYKTDSFLNKRFFSDRLFEFFLKKKNLHKQLFDLLDLINHVSPNLRSSSFDLIFQVITQVDDVEQRTSYFLQALILAEKYGFNKVDINEIRIFDMEQITFSALRMLMLQGNIDIGLIRNILETISAELDSCSKANSLVYLSYYLYSKELKTQLNEVILKILECIDALNSHCKIKTMLRLLPVLQNTQKTAFFESILDLVIEAEKSEGAILQTSLGNPVKVSDIYADMTLIAAQLGNFDLAFEMSRVIPFDPPQRGLILRRIKSVPKDFALKMFEFSVADLDKQLDSKSKAKVDSAIIDILFLLPSLPSDFSFDIEKQIVRIDDDLKFTLINATVPYLNVASLKRIMSFSRATFDEDRMLTISANALSRYVKLGQISLAKELLKEVKKDNWRTIKSALEIISVDNDPDVAGMLTTAFTDLADTIFLSSQKNIFLHHAKISVDLIREYAGLLGIVKYKTYYNGHDRDLLPFRIALKLFEYDLSEDETELIVDECLSELDRQPYWSFGVFGAEPVELLDLNIFDFDPIKYKRAKLTEMLQPIYHSLSKKSQVKILKKHMEYFLQQPRGEMLVEISALLPIFCPPKNENWASGMIGDIFQVYSWWR